MGAVRVLRWAWVAALASTWACADGGATTGGEGGTDGALHLVQTKPADGASDVEADVLLSAQFDATLNQTSVTPSSFRVLRDDGAEVEGSLSVVGDTATFTPTRTLGLLRTYTATVTTEIGGLSGETLEASISWQFSTRDGAWGEPVLVEINNAGNANYPEVAVAGDGTAFVVWLQFDGTRYNLWANRFTPGAGWGEAVVIESNDAGVVNLDVTAGPDGVAIAVWAQDDGIHDRIWANRFTPAAGWGVAEKIDSGPGPADHPVVAMDPDGNAIAVWEQLDGTRFNIWANRFTPAAGWGVAERIGRDELGSAYEPEVAVDANGRAIVVWEQYDGTRNDVWANRFTPTGGWATAELLELENSDSVDSSTVAVDPDGNAIAIWRLGYNIWVNRLTPTTGWGTAEAIETDDAADPDVALDSRGNAIAVWGAKGPQYGIWARFFAPGQGWGDPVQVSDRDSGEYPTVGLDPNGNAIVVWLDRDPAAARLDLWASRFTPTNGWQTAQLIEANDVGSTDYQQLAVDADGRALAVWPQTNVSRYDIWANRFE